VLEGAGENSKNSEKKMFREDFSAGVVRKSRARGADWASVLGFKTTKLLKHQVPGALSVLARRH
jgi:hypothetical protein